MRAVTQLQKSNRAKTKLLCDKICLSNNNNNSKQLFCNICCCFYGFLNVNVSADKNVRKGKSFSMKLCTAHTLPSLHLLPPRSLYSIVVSLSAAYLSSSWTRWTDCECVKWLPYSPQLPKQRARRCKAW